MVREDLRRETLLAIYQSNIYLALVLFIYSISKRVTCSAKHFTLLADCRSLDIESRLFNALYSSANTLRLSPYNFPAS